MGPISLEEMAEYRATARRRQQRERQDLERRRARAWEAARHAAQLLRDEFGTTRVVVFGSLVDDAGFTPWSDVDLAAWGLAASDTFRAVSAVLGCSSEVEVNLVDVTSCSASLLRTIEEKGVEL